MYIRFLSAVGNGRWSFAENDIVDWPDDAEAKAWIERNQAEPLTKADAERLAEKTGRPVRQGVKTEKKVVPPWGGTAGDELTAILQDDPQYLDRLRRDREAGMRKQSGLARAVK